MSSAPDQFNKLRDLSDQLLSTIAFLIDKAEETGDDELRINAHEMLELATGVDDYIRRTSLEQQSKPPPPPSTEKGPE